MLNPQTYKLVCHLNMKLVGHYFGLILKPTNLMEFCSKAIAQFGYFYSLYRLPRVLGV